jgi:lipopolysaccharide export system permease protein
MMILQAHILKIVGSRVLAALIILLSILQILDLLDVTTDIIDRELGVRGVMYYSLLRIPAQLEQVAPLAVLAGSLFAFTQLARENAVIAMRSSGMAVYRLVAIAAPAAAVMAALHIACLLWAAPYAQQSLDAWWDKSTPAADRTAKDPRSFRIGGDIAVATLADPSGRRVTDLTVYGRDPEGRLISRLTAKTAAFGAEGWSLTGVRREMLDPTGVRLDTLAEPFVIPGPPPADVQAAFSVEQTLAPGMARRALEGGVSNMPQSYYRTQLARNFAAPVTALVMLLLAAPAALLNPRAGGTKIVVLSLAAGLVFLVVDGLCTALGESGTVPALLAAWAAPAMFAAAAATALLYMER